MGVSKVEEKGINIGRSENTCQNHHNQKVMRLKKKGMSRRKEYVEKKIIPKRKIWEGPSAGHSR